MISYGRKKPFASDKIRYPERVNIYITILWDNANIHIILLFLFFISLIFYLLS